MNYRDIDLNLKKTPNKDVPILRDSASIKTSIMNLLSFQMHDIFLNDFFGGFLKDILFENDNQVEESLLSTRIEWILETYETRIKVNDIDINYSDEVTLAININYTIIDNDFNDNLIYLKDLVNENRL